MKKLFLFLVILIAASAIWAKDFSSEIINLNAAGFPRIEATIKVFNKQAEILKKDNFIISEEDKNIISFEIEPKKCNHYMILVIDRSSSIAPAMDNVKKAAANFVAGMIENVSVAILSFGSDLDFNHRFSKDGKSLIKAIYNIRPWGGTALYDAIYTAAEELNNKAGKNDLKTIVCLTDGRDSTPNGHTPLSTHTPDQVVKFASEKGIRIVTVGLGNDIDHAVLAKFAKSTGGWYLKTTNPQDLSNLYEALSQRMKLEKYYRLTYTTPSPQPDGTKRTVTIKSRLKGYTDQGSAQYTAPTRTVSIPDHETTGMSGKKQSLTLAFQDLNIAGPDSVYLTGPITPPPPAPVIGLNSAALLGSDAKQCQAIIDQARRRIAEEHNRNYDKRKKYLDEYLENIEKLQKENDKRAAAPDLREFEKPRIEYRNKYLEFRRNEIELHLQQVYEEYQIAFKASMDELDYYQKIYVNGEPEDDEFLSINNASETAALNKVEDKFRKLFDEIDEKREAYFNETLDKRGANVETTTREETYELDAPAIPDRTANPSHLINDMENLIKKRTYESIGADEDEDEDDYDSDSVDIPRIEPLD
ncbi:MAG: hypothetical protein Kow0029_03530 [Candidatus Rifleibacteriota bacterium]